MAVQRRTIGRLPVARGKWNSSDTYYKYNVVSNDGSSFMSVKEDSFSGSNYEPTVELDGTNFKVYFGGTLQDGTNDVWQLMSYGRDANLSVRYVTCDSASDANKTLNITGFELTTNMRYLIKMDNVNTIDNATLNISGTGAKLIMYNGSAASSTNSWIAGEVLDVYYDGTNYIAITFGGAKFATGERLDTIGIDYEPIKDSNDLITSGAVSTALENVAYKDGDYSEDGLVSAKAQNLVGEPIEITSVYTSKPTALDSSGEPIEVADGRCWMNEVDGRGVSWNQGLRISTTSSNLNQFSNNGLTPTVLGEGIIAFSGTASATDYVGTNYNKKVTLISGHKYYARACVKKTTPFFMTGFSDIWFYSGVGIKIANQSIESSIVLSITKDTTYNDIYAPICIDLTLLCPHLASKANLTVAEVEAYLATLMTPKPYYAQNNGQLLGAKMLGWQLRKTPNLLNPTTKQAKLFEYEYSGHDNEYEVTGFDNLTGAALQFTPYNTGVTEAVTLDSNNVFTIPSAGILEVVEAIEGTPITGDVSLVCVKAVYDGTKAGEFARFSEDDITFDSANIYHKSGDVYSQVFDGGVMRATGDATDSVRDELGFDEITGKCFAEVNVGDVDLGTLSWADYGGNKRLCAGDVASAPVKESGCKFINPKYDTILYHIWSERSATGLWLGDPIVTLRTKRFFLYDGVHGDSDLNDGHASWLEGVHCFYELQTPQTYTSDLYYKTGEDTYVPLEKIWPLIGQCCNWASENLVEQGDDAQGQPQSITPITTEVFQSDLKELLKTIGDTYISREQAKGSFNNLLTTINANCSTVLGGTLSTSSETDASGNLQFEFTPNA